MEVGRRQFLLGTSTFGFATAAGELRSAETAGPLVLNPYQAIPAGAAWLRGELHSHVGKADDGGVLCESGAEAGLVYRAAAAAQLDFVALSVEVTASCGGAERGADDALGVIGIAAREIQNNLYGPEPYFSEPGAAYLHVLTLGRSGLSICVHPRFYDMIEDRRTSWSDIRSALLAPLPGGSLESLGVAGIEIYNGYTLAVLRERGQESLYRDYDESCWDEVLMSGRLLWGFAANDGFVASQDYKTLSPLGTVLVAVEEKSPSGIVAALAQGRFYSSTGIGLAKQPMAVAEGGGALRIAVAAEEEVHWTALIGRRVDGVARLDRLAVPNAAQAEFAVEPGWAYVRVQCQGVRDPWRRAWLQPIVDRTRFSVP
jgi:hypothetical protein